MLASAGSYRDALEERSATRRDGLTELANARNPCPKSPPAERLLAAGSAQMPNPPAVFARKLEIAGDYRSCQSLRTAAANLRIRSAGPHAISQRASTSHPDS